MSNSKHARFCFNNFVESGSYSTSSASSTYPATNLVSGIRSKVWQANGLFEITATNNKVYIDSTTYTVPVASYSVTTLITAFNTATGATLSRNSNGRFIITLGASGTFNIATTTNAIWTTLGFLGTADVTGATITADERRYNTSEWILVDMGLPQAANFAALIPPSGTVFSAPTASIYLQGNNINNWNSPTVNQAMTVSSEGAFTTIDLDTVGCRYWRIKIVDVKNSTISASVAYIGNCVSPSNTNVSVGLTRNRSDTSIRMYSEGGQLYVDRRPRVLSLKSVGMLYLKDQDLIDMEQLVYDLGNGRPFFVVVDPQTQVSDTLSQMTHYVEVDGDVTFDHVLSDYYNVSFTLREAL